jgi:UDP-N-acetylglucosamine--N-acetylmuramyl-(pentapeptide) pyrophosphoryl-undecaprenol N-acetylglucosamine transferase
LKILFACGGTGGHIHPALAIAQAFCDADPNAQISFCGTPNGLEKELVTKSGYPFHSIPLQGLRRSLSLSNFKTAWLLFRSRHRAKKLLKSLQPDLVIGTGGYICYPLLRAAARAGIPCALHESNAIPGLTCKVLSRKIPIILTNFSTTSQYLPKANQMIRVGNPLRSGFLSLSHEAARAKLHLSNQKTRMILSFGGSLGAEPLNDTILAWYRDVCAKRSDLFCVHVCGSRDYARSKQLFYDYGLDRCKNLCLMEYLYDMPTYLRACDLAICRAGAMTLSELALCQTPAILIPSPYVTNNHQFHNACALRDSGAALLIEEKDLSVKSLNQAVSSLFQNPKDYQKMKNAMARFATPHAAKTIVQILSEKFSL